MTINENYSRIPTLNFRGQKIVNEDGTLTDVAQNYFDQLESVLKKVLGNEGLLSPSQDSNSISQIQNYKIYSPTGSTVYTCDYGNFIYDTTNNHVKVSLDDGTGKPIFKVVVTM